MQLKVLECPPSRCNFNWLHRPPLCDALLRAAHSKPFNDLQNNEQRIKMCMQYICHMCSVHSQQSLSLSRGHVGSGRRGGALAGVCRGHCGARQPGSDCGARELCQCYATEGPGEDTT